MNAREDLIEVTDRAIASCFVVQEEILPDGLTRTTRELAEVAVNAILAELDIVDFDKNIAWPERLEMIGRAYDDMRETVAGRLDPTRLNTGLDVLAIIDDARKEVVGLSSNLDTHPILDIDAPYPPPEKDAFGRAL